MDSYNHDSFGQCDVGAPDFRSAARVGTKAPGFTLTDLDGRKLSLADFKGKSTCFLSLEASPDPPLWGRFLHSRNSMKNISPRPLNFLSSMSAKPTREKIFHTIPLLSKSSLTQESCGSWRKSAPRSWWTILRALRTRPMGYCPTWSISSTAKGPLCTNPIGQMPLN